MESQLQCKKRKIMPRSADEYVSRFIDSGSDVNVMVDILDELSKTTTTNVIMSSIITPLCMVSLKNCCSIFESFFKKTANPNFPRMFLGSKYCRQFMSVFLSHVIFSSDLSEFMKSINFALLNKEELTTNYIWNDNTDEIFGEFIAKCILTNNSAILQHHSLYRIVSLNTITFAFSKITAENLSCVAERTWQSIFTLKNFPHCFYHDGQLVREPMDHGFSLSEMAHVCEKIDTCLCRPNGALINIHTFLRPKLTILNFLAKIYSFLDMSGELWYQPFVCDVVFSYCVAGEMYMLQSLKYMTRNDLDHIQYCSTVSTKNQCCEHSTGTDHLRNMCINLQEIYTSDSFLSANYKHLYIKMMKLLTGNFLTGPHNYNEIKTLFNLIRTSHIFKVKDDVVSTKNAERKDLRNRLYILQAAYGIPLCDEPVTDKALFQIQHVLPKSLRGTILNRTSFFSLSKTQQTRLKTLLMVRQRMRSTGNTIPNIPDDCWNIIYGYFIVDNQSVFYLHANLSPETIKEQLLSAKNNLDRTIKHCYVHFRTEMEAEKKLRCKVSNVAYCLDLECSIETAGNMDVNKLIQHVKDALPKRYGRIREEQEENRLAYLLIQETLFWNKLGDMFDVQRELVVQQRELASAKKRLEELFFSISAFMRNICA